jgi:phage FluMu protein Com
MSFYGAVYGAFIKLTCPKCKEVQVRARRPPLQKVRCRKCDHEFVVADGRPEPTTIERK